MFTQSVTTTRVILFDLWIVPTDKFEIDTKSVLVVWYSGEETRRKVQAGRKLVSPIRRTLQRRPRCVGFSYGFPLYIVNVKTVECISFRCDFSISTDTNGYDVETFGTKTESAKRSYVYKPEFIPPPPVFTSRVFWYKHITIRAENA